MEYIQIVYQSNKSKEPNTVQKELKPKEERKHTLKYTLYSYMYLHNILPRKEEADLRIIIQSKTKNCSYCYDHLQREYNKLTNK